MLQDLDTNLKNSYYLFSLIALLAGAFGALLLLTSKNATSWNQQGIYDFSGSIFSVGLGLAFIIIACFSFTISFWCKIEYLKLKEQKL